MAARHCRPRASSSIHGPTRPGPARPPHRESARRIGLPQPHRPGRRRAVLRAHAGRRRAGRSQGQPRDLRHAGKHSGLGTGQHRHDPHWRGPPRNGGRTAPPRPKPFVPHSHRSPLPRLHRGIVLELRRRILPPAPDATTPGTTGTALTNRATGPEEGQQPARAQVLSRATRSSPMGDIEKSKVIRS